MQIAFDNTYARLPENFFARVVPTRVAAPRLIALNEKLAAELGLNPAELASPEGVEMLSGNLVPPEAASIATAYAGHQFGNFVPQLGDGRAILLGEVVGPDGVRRDIQLKGPGRTPFSRDGDGRAALGPVLREYLLSEAMAALGVPTTRALAAVATGQSVWRDTTLPGGVLTRVASSHIRVGTFQYFAARGDTESLRTLTDHALARHYPDAPDAPTPAQKLLAGVIARQAHLVARWLLVGFVHGVMNTDNTSISGETIDYGPCAFIDAYDPQTVFSSIDHAGRYAYANQPRIAQWNLTRLAEALLPLLDENPDTAIEIAKQELDGFRPVFEATYLGGLRQKIGLSTERDGDTPLLQDLLAAMQAGAADFTQTFRLLADAAADPHADAPIEALFTDPAPYTAWATRWRLRLAADDTDPANRHAAMQAANPAYIPRNHLVEAALEAACQHQDFSPFNRLHAVLAHPYTPQPDADLYATPPPPPESPYRTFCGT